MSQNKKLSGNELKQKLLQEARKAYQSVRNKQQ